MRARLGSEMSASFAVGSEEIGGWGEKVLTAHSSRDQGISLGFGGDEEEEDREILEEEKRDTADLRHIVLLVKRITRR